MDRANQAGHSHVLGTASLAQQLESRPRLIIRNVDEYEYDPHYVSIGPYHWSRSDSSSLARKEDKTRCLDAVLRASLRRSRAERAGEGHPRRAAEGRGQSEVLEQDIHGELEKVEGRARSWYHRNFQDMTRQEFVRMLLLDGCYILVRFGYVNEGGDTTLPVAAAGGDTDRLEDIDVANVIVQEGDDTAPPVAAAGGDTDRLEDVDVANSIVQEGDDTAPSVAVAGGDTDRLEDVDVDNGIVQEGDNTALPVAAADGDTDRLEDVDVEGDNTAPPMAAAGGDADRLENVDVVRDVFYLVENQIPYFVIEKILWKTGGKDSAESNIVAYVRRLLEGHRYVAATWGVEAQLALTESRRLLTKSRHLLHLLHLHLKPTIDPVSATGGTSATGRLGHLLHLLHLHLKPLIDLVSATGGTSATDTSVGRWRTATEYDFAGIKLKKRALSTEEARCILDVRLDRRGGTLHVPCLNIDRETWRLLRSLTALELHNRVVGSHVTAYCVFMSQVACNPQDVALLSKEGIIVHQMGNHGEVADHFANLCKGVVFDANEATDNYLRETCQALEKRFRSRRGRWMAWLRRKYFSNPWLVVGLVAAAIGLACAVVQAVYSVLSYNKGPN